MLARILPGGLRGTKHMALAPAGGSKCPAIYQLQLPGGTTDKMPAPDWRVSITFAHILSGRIHRLGLGSPDSRGIRVRVGIPSPLILALANKD